MREMEREIARLRQSLRRMLPDAGKRWAAPVDVDVTVQPWAELYRQYSMRRDG